MSDQGPFGRPQRPDEDPRETPRYEDDPPTLGPPVEESSPDPPKRRPGPPRPPAGLAGNATWIAGVAVVIILAFVTINTITTKSNGSRGVSAGQKVPPFAAPLALANAKCGKDDCDASVLIHKRGNHPLACDVRGPNILNSCQLRERGPSVIAFLVAPSQKCIDQIDTLQRLKPRFPEIQFAAVAIRGNHAKLNGIIKRHGWTLPVGYDHDGAVANAFAVAICPTITFVRKGGEVAATTLGTASEADIARDLRKISARVPR